MADKITYVPTVIKWVENGKEQKRIVNIEEGFKFNFNGKSYTAQAYKNMGKAPSLLLSKEDAYAIMGFSKMNGDSKVAKNGQKEYTLDRNDWDMAMRLRGGSNGLLLGRMQSLAPEAHTYKAQFGYDYEKNQVLNNKFELNKISIFYDKK